MTLHLSDEKPKIKDFLSKNQIAVLGTVGDDQKPHTATIYIQADEDLNIFFITKEKTTKYRNLKSNPNVALTVYEPVSQTTVQASGIAEEITDIAKTNEIFRRVLSVTRGTSESSVPPVSKLEGGEYKCFQIKPTIVRLAEYTKPEHGEFDGIFDTVVVPDQEL